MAQYDGSIRINTDISVKSAEKQLKALENNMEKTATKVASLRDKMDSLRSVQIPTDEYKEIQKQISSTDNKLNNLLARQEKFLEMGGKKGSSTYKKMEYDIEQLEKTLEFAKADMQDLVDSGQAFVLGSGAEEYSKLGQQLKYAEDSLEIMNQQHKILEDRLNAANQKRETERQKIEESAAEEERLAGLRENAVVGNQRIVETLERIKELEQEIADLKAAGITEGYKDYDDRVQELEGLKQEVRDYNNGVDDTKKNYGKLSEVAKRVLQSTSNLLKKATSYVFSLGNSLKNIAQKLFPSLNKSTKKTNSLLSSTGMSFKNILKYALGIRSLYALFSKVRSAAKEGFQNLAQYSSQTNTDISMLISSLLQLKNSLATAFAPILTVVAPILKSFISLLSQAATYVSHFMSALTGKSTYIRATEVQKDYAASLKATGKAAKDAAGSLSAYDKINPIQDKNTGGSGAGSGAEINPENMFETLDVESSVLDLAERIKEAWEKADFTDIGNSLGEKLKNMLENIPWNEIKQKAYDLGKSLATLLNGVFRTEGLGERIGKTIAEALNTALSFAYGFIHNFDFSAFGKFVGNGINGAFLTFDWNILSKTLAEAINGIFLFLLEFSRTVKWYEIGTVISETINTFFKKWKPEIMSTGISEFIKGILDLLISVVGGTDWKLVGQKIGQFVTEIDWEGIATRLGEFLAKALNGVFETLVEFATTIDWERIGIAISDGINTLFQQWNLETMADGISEFVKGILDVIINFVENTDWKLIGEKIAIFVSEIDWSGIADRLFEGIGAALGGLAAFLGGAIEEAVSSAKEYFSEKIEEAGGDIVLGILQGIIEAIKGIGEWIIQHIFQPFIDGFKEAFGIHSPSTVMAEMGTYLIQGLIEGISSLIEDVIAIFENIKQKITEVWDSLKQTTSTVWNGIKSTISGIWNGIKTTASTVFSGLGTIISTAWNTIKTVSSNVWNGIKTTLSSLWDSMRTTASNVFNGIKNETVNIFNNLKTKILNIWDGITEGIKKAVNKVKDAVNSIKDKVSSGFNSVFGKEESSFYSSSSYSTRSIVPDVPIPHLATGAVIPPNKEFLAVLGDQKKGTNIETPIDTMIDAFKQALKEVGGTGTGGGTGKVEIVLQIDRDVVARQLVDLNKQRVKSGGKPLFAQ